MQTRFHIHPEKLGDRRKSRWVVGCYLARGVQHYLRARVRHLAQRLPHWPGRHAEDIHQRLNRHRVARLALDRAISTLLSGRNADDAKKRR